MKVAIVAPVHIQPSKEWINALTSIHARGEADIILVDDSDGQLELPSVFDTYDYGRQKHVMGKELYALFQQFQHSASCKQFGLWRAYHLGYDIVIVIDSDCIIEDHGFVMRHTHMLYQFGQGWDNPLRGTSWYSRGFPYSKRDLPIWAHMGLWDNEWDLYGKDRLTKDFKRRRMLEMERATPAGYFPLSGMNVSFKREAIPYMLFLPNFTSKEGQKFTRHDDIWGGYIFQKLAKAHGAALSYGAPYVFHDTVVVPQEDAEAEVPMIEHEDSFYAFIDSLLDLRPGLEDAIPYEVFDYMANANSLLGPFKNLLPAFRFQAEAFK